MKSNTQNTESHCTQYYNSAKETLEKQKHKEPVMSRQALRKEHTNHPFIVKNRNVCNGSPIIEGTRTRVVDIAIEYEILGQSPDEIVNSHPNLNLSQVHDALSYYYENRVEMDQKLERDREFITKLKASFPSRMAQPG